MNRTEPLCCSGVLSGVCACVGVVKGTVLCADPLGQPYVCVLECLLGLCAQLPHHWLETHCCGSLASMGTGVTLGQEGSPWGPRPLCCTSNSTQLQSTACNRTISCPGELHRSGTHCWLLFFPNCSPPTLFDSLRFTSHKTQWKLAPTSSLCASHESSCKQCSEKVIKVWRDHHKTEPLESHHLLSAANCNYSSGYGTDGQSFLLQNTVPLENELSCLKNSFWSFLKLL